MGPGTLYGSLDRMMRDGLVEETGLSDDERRRYYRLTLRGRAALAAELQRLDAAVKSARAQGLLPQRGQGIRLTLDNTLLHSLCKLLQTAVAKSDWDIVLQLPTLQSQLDVDAAAMPKSVN